MTDTHDNDVNTAAKRRIPSLVKPVLLGVVVATMLPILPYADEKLGTAVAQSVADGGRARMNLAGELNILGQTISAAACMMDIEFNVAHEREVLLHAHDDFQRMLLALENGDPLLGVPDGERYSKAILALREVRALWEPMDVAVMALLDGDHPHEHAKVIAETNQELLEKTEKLSSIILNEYANPFETMLTDALAISIAERQEVFAERLKREACEIGSDHADDEIKADFIKTIDLFERSLFALHDGMPAAGISPPPNDEIKYQLEEAAAQWTEAKPVLQSILDSHAASEEEMTHICELTEALDARMHTVVIEYVLTAPGANDMLRIPLESYAAEILASWVTDPVLIEAIKKHNRESAHLSDADITALEAQWEHEAPNGEGPLVDKIRLHEASVHLHELQNSTSDVVTEAFIMDNRGLNVAESEVTPEYFHGKEERWTEIMLHNSHDIFIGEIHIEEGGHIYQSQISIPVKDPGTGERIGVATFGINVQSMF